MNLKVSKEFIECLINSIASGDDVEITGLKINGEKVAGMVLNGSIIFRDRTSKDYLKEQYNEEYEKLSGIHVIYAPNVQSDVDSNT